MEYRQLPHGNEREKFGVLGLGFGGIGTTPADEIEAIVRKAIACGINFFDMCTADTITGTCVYCNHCQPCPAGIDIGLVNKYYDLALAGDDIAANHYTKLGVNADACLKCGHCEERCPFRVKQMSRMRAIDEYFAKR